MAAQRSPPSAPAHSVQAAVAVHGLLQLLSVRSFRYFKIANSVCNGFLVVGSDHQIKF